MAAEYSSSNPFRRKETASKAPLNYPSVPNADRIEYQRADPPPETKPFSETDAPKKILKKVRVQSPPPPSSPSIPDSSSTIGEDAYSSKEQHLPGASLDDDPFDSTNSDSDGNNEVVTEGPRHAPPNPFSKTLETMEYAGRDTSGLVPTNAAGVGKGSLDVDAFKRLLMTGSSSMESTTLPPAQPPPVTLALGDGGSTTDASSVSRQSIFDNIQEPHGESPRTSHEISEPEDDRRGLADYTSIMGRKKPPPPSSRHGKLIKMELRDDPTIITVQSPNTPGSITSQNYFSASPHSQTDLNKPLPPAPVRASHDSDRESIFDKEAAGKVPDPPSPPVSLRRKTPPAPPLARRHSQLVSDSKRMRSESGRLSPKQEEETANLRVDTTGRPRADSARAPPPPPSRRPGSIIRGQSHHAVLTSPSTGSLPSSSPAPPPTRSLSRHISSGRPPSVRSLDISTNTTSKRGPPMPPPPPPHRHGRSSMDGASPGASQRQSGEMRRSIDSGRRGSEASSLSQVERNENVPPEGSSTPGKLNVLDDLTALQREIDALRGQSEKDRNVA